MVVGVGGGRGRRGSGSVDKWACLIIMLFIQNCCAHLRVSYCVVKNMCIFLDAQHLYNQSTPSTCSKAVLASQVYCPVLAKSRRTTQLQHAQEESVFSLSMSLSLDALLKGMNSSKNSIHSFNCNG